MGTASRIACICGIGLVAAAALLIWSWWLRKPSYVTTTGIEINKPVISKPITVSKQRPKVEFPVDWGQAESPSEAEAEISTAANTKANSDSEAQPIVNELAHEEPREVISLDPYKGEKDITECVGWEYPAKGYPYFVDREGNVYSSCIGAIFRLDVDGQYSESRDLGRSTANSMMFTARDDGAVVAFNDSAELIALDSSLSEIWRISSQLETEFDKPEEDWTISREHNMYKNPGNCVLLAREVVGNYGLAALYSEQGEMLWKRWFLGGKMPIQGADGRLYTPDYGGATVMAYFAECEPLYRRYIGLPGITGSMIEGGCRSLLMAAGGRDGTLVLRCVLLKLPDSDPGTKGCGVRYDLLPSYYSAVVVLNADGTERWRRTCDIAAIPPAVADDGTIYVVAEDYLETNCVLQYAADGEPLRRLHTSCVIDRIDLLEGGQKAILTLSNVRNLGAESTHYEATHLVLVDSKFQLLKSIRLAGRHHKSSLVLAGLLKGDDNKIYLTYCRGKSFYTCAVQL